MMILLSYEYWPYLCCAIGNSLLSNMIVNHQQFSIESFFTSFVEPFFLTFLVSLNTAFHFLMLFLDFLCSFRMVFFDFIVLLFYFCLFPFYLFFRSLMFIESIPSKFL